MSRYWILVVMFALKTKAPAITGSRRLLEWRANNVTLLPSNKAQVSVEREGFIYSARFMIHVKPGSLRFVVGRSRTSSRKDFRTECMGMYVMYEKT